MEKFRSIEDRFRKRGTFVRRTSSRRKERKRRNAHRKRCKHYPRATTRREECCRSISQYRNTSGCMREALTRTHAWRVRAVRKPPKWPRQWHGSILAGTGYPEREFLCRAFLFSLPFSPSSQIIKSADSTLRKHTERT